MIIPLSQRLMPPNKVGIIFQKHFGGSTGYGHEDAGGREALDQAFAEIVGAESAIVRSQFFAVTHDITCALFAFLDKPSHHKAIEPVVESIKDRASASAADQKTC